MPKILLVEDDVQTVELIEFVLGPKGYEIVTIPNGSLTLSKAKEIRPGLILLDVMLPGLDGYAVQNKLLEDPDTKDIPVIVMTAKVDTESRFRGATNVRHFISKPFNVKEFFEKVKAVLPPR